MRIEFGENFKKGVDTLVNYIEESKKEIETIFDGAAEVIEKCNRTDVKEGFLNLEKYYNEQILTDEKKLIKEWAEGEGSCYNFAKINKASEDSIKFAKDQQEVITDSIDSMVEIDKIKDMTLGSTEYESTRLVTDIENLCSDARNVINQINDEYFTELNNKATENDAIQSLIIAFTIISGKNNIFAEDAIKKLNEKLGEGLKLSETEHTKATNESTENVKKAIESTTAFLDEFNKNFGSELD